MGSKNVKKITQTQVLHKLSSVSFLFVLVVTLMS